MVSTSRGGAKEIALGALFAGLVAVATMIHVPMPGYRIYFNLGEGALYCIALLMGSKYGNLAGLWRACRYCARISSLGSFYIFN